MNNYVVNSPLLGTVMTKISKDKVKLKNEYIQFREHVLNGPHM